jgi:hypothetical protein
MKKVSIARKLSTIDERRQQNCFNEVTGTKVTNPETVLGSSLGEGVGFRDNFFYDIQLYVSNDQAYDNLSGNKDW